MKERVVAVLPSGWQEFFGLFQILSHGWACSRASAATARQTDWEQLGTL
jgi:hypothetical protein